VKVLYENVNLRAEALKTIDRVNEVIDEYAAQGLTLTLRQAFYQFVSRGWIENKDSEYKRLGGIVSDGRMAGLVDWDAIEDRTRFLRALPAWKDPADIVSACAHQYKTSWWADQPTYVEVWVEKDALIGVLESACRPLDVPYLSCRGYTSQTEMRAAAVRIALQILKRKRAVVIHLGDHDPSGMDMSRDIEARLQTFLEVEAETHWVDNFEVRRIALTMAQVQKYNPPPNPAKNTDSRFQEYGKLYGGSSWELDALNPTVLRALISDEVMLEVDQTLLKAAMQRDEDGRERLKKVVEKMRKGKL